MISGIRKFYTNTLLCSSSTSRSIIVMSSISTSSISSISRTSSIISGVRSALLLLVRRCTSTNNMDVTM